MVTVVTYDVETKQVISCCPIQMYCEDAVTIEEMDGIIKSGYDYQIYNGTQPVFFDDEDGNVCLRLDAVLLDADYLNDDKEE